MSFIILFTSSLSQKYLGKGIYLPVDSSEGRITLARCFKTISETHKCQNINSAQIDTTYVNTKEEVENAINSGFDIKLGIDKVGSIEPKFKIDKLFKEDKLEYSLFFSFTANRTDEYTLEEIGEDIIATQNMRDRYINNRESFYKVCGNQLISAVESKASVIVKFSMKATNKLDNQKYDIGLNLTKDEQAQLGPIKDLKLDFFFNKLDKNEKYNAELNIQANQIGGNPARLSTIFKNFMQGIKCTFDNLDACKVLIADIVDYVSNDFSKQVDCNDQKDPNYSILSLSHLKIVSVDDIVNE